MKTPNEKIRIAPLSISDIPFALEMTSKEGWGYTEADWRRILDIEPIGCFVAWLNDTPVGTITSVSYSDFAFLGGLIVKKEVRGQRIGESLMLHAIDRLQRLGAETIELDGVIPALPLYRRIGFKDKWLSLRFLRPPDQHTPKKVLTRPRAQTDILALDSRLYEIDRSRLLNRFVSELKESAFVDNSESPAAYALLRPRTDGRLAIAPLIAENSERAEALLGQIVEQYTSTPLSAGVPAVNADMIRMMLKRGFLYTQPSLRMYLGKYREYGAHAYTILTPDKG